MKKKVLSWLAVLAVAVTATWNLNFSSQKSGMSDLALANVEALAQSESGIFYCSGKPVPLVCVWTEDGKPYEAGEKIWL